MTDCDDDLDPIRALRPDLVQSDDAADPAAFARRRRRLMEIADDAVVASSMATPDAYARLAYLDEYAAIGYLTRVFGFDEVREARLEHDDHCLAWFRIGTGMVMVGHANVDVHRIHSPAAVGLTTVMLNVYVDDVDDHYAHAVAEGADVTMPLADAFYGERCYEVTDLEGHRWHFAERFESIRARQSLDG